MQRALPAPSPPGPSLPAPRRAETDDLLGYLALRDAAAAWLTARGICQWAPGKWAQSASQAVAEGELWVLDDPAGPPGALIGGLRLQWDDADGWPERVGSGDSGYVHGLVVARRHAGRGVPTALLDHARLEVLAADRRWLRLDCRAANAALRRYYAALGFTELDVRAVVFPDRVHFDAEMARFELDARQAVGDAGSSRRRSSLSPPAAPPAAAADSALRR